MPSCKFVFSNLSPVGLDELEVIIFLEYDCEKED